MYIACMKHSYGACCMTAELCSFCVLNDQWIERQKRYYSTVDLPQLLSGFFGFTPLRLLAEKRDYYNDKFYGVGETVEEAWQNALAEVQASVNRCSYAGKQVRYFWFVRHEGQDTYDNEALRAIVQKLPNVVSMGNYVNANSRNEVDGYLAVFTNENGNKYLEEDEDYDNE